jgi:TRAP-type C4-dicarboxylate transport system permease small subunit
MIVKNQLFSSVLVLSCLFLFMFTCTTKAQQYQVTVSAGDIDRMWNDFAYPVGVTVRNK